MPDRFFEALSRARGIGQDSIPSSANRLIKDRLDAAKLGQEACIIDAPTVTGKTHAVMAFTLDYPTETYAVRASDDMSAWHWMRELTRVTGAEPDGGSPSIYGMLKAVGLRLGRDQYSLNIVDVAENLKKPVYDLLEDGVRSRWWGPTITTLTYKDYRS